MKADQVKQPKGTKARELAPVTNSPQKYPQGLVLVAILLSLALGTFLMALDTTIITVAIPKIITEFDALDELGWVGSAYLITLTAFQPIAGSMYKSFSPRLLYIIFIAIFEIGSTLCASATLIQTFILGRAIAGVGAAGLLQGALGILTFISSLERRPIYMAVVISVFGISSSMGPILGGVFTDRVSWRWCFWVNLPLGLVAFVLAVCCMDLKHVESSPERQLRLSAKLKSFDMVGISLLLGFVSCLCIALQDGGNDFSWGSARVVGLLVGFVALKVAFWVSQWWLGERALIPIRFLRQRTVAFGSLFLFCDNMSNYLKLYYLPFYFQAVRNTSAMRSGINYIALAVPQFVALLVSGGLITRFGHYMPVILTGQIICVVGTGLLTRIAISTAKATWAAELAITGFGLGMSINAPHIAIQAVMDTETDVFLANGVATFFSQLGGTIAIPIGNSLLLNALSHYLTIFAPEVTAHQAVQAGPLAIEKLSSDAQSIHGVRLAYEKAIQHILIYALAIVCASVPIACGMQWLNVKEVSQTREGQKPSEQICQPTATSQVL